MQPADVPTNINVLFLALRYITYPNSLKSPESLNQLLMCLD